MNEIMEFTLINIKDGWWLFLVCSVLATIASYITKIIGAKEYAKNKLSTDIFTMTRAEFNDLKNSSAFSKLKYYSELLLSYQYITQLSLFLFKVSFVINAFVFFK